MKLTLGIGESIEDPTAEQVEAALRALPGGDDSFAILGIDDQTYIQTAGGGPDGFALEYREGSQTSHYRCTNEHLAVDPVVAAFRDYLSGRSDYKSDLAWELESAPAGARGGAGVRLGAAVLGVLAALAFSLYRCGS